jgi:exodeoxyribonuclease-1
VNSYLFYDIETTGLNKAFDQVLQFAAIRTDMTLKEIDRHVIMLRLRPDIICSPRAMITNRISVKDSMTGLCEYEAIREIHNLMNETGTISLGYNSLGFDDEFLRFSFYRNLLPPYTHQFNNACGRMDLLPITIIYWLFKRKSLNWPQKDGKLTLKLEHLNTANQLAAGYAHDALVDVEATVELARKFFVEIETWSYVRGYFDKATDANRTEKLPVALSTDAGKHRKGLLVSAEYGADLRYMIPVLSIGNSIPYNNQSLWLRLDQPQLCETTSETIPESIWVTRKKFGEPGILLPPYKRYWKYLDPDRAKCVKKNEFWLMSNDELFQKIIQYHREYRYPSVPDLDVDAALYEIGFLSRQEQKLCRRFHAAPQDDKIKIATRFPSSEMREIASRLLCRNYPENLPKQFEMNFVGYMQRVNPRCKKDALLDYKGNRRTTPIDAISEIHELKREYNLDSVQLELLDELENYINQKFPSR